MSYKEILVHVDNSKHCAKRLAVALGLAAQLVVAALAGTAAAHGPQGQGGMIGPGQGGMMGQGQGGMLGPGQGGMMGPGQGGMMMGPGMMGQGMMSPEMMGQGMMGFGQRVVPIRDLEADDVQHYLEHRIAAQGYSRLKVGKVEEKDENTITAEIVTADGALVQRIEVDRHTGVMREVN